MDHVFELPLLPPGDPCYAAMGIHKKYWSAGDTQLKALRAEARAKGETFAVVFWDIKSYVSSPVQAAEWEPSRSDRLMLEEGLRAELAWPKLPEHITPELRRHVFTLQERALAKYQARLAYLEQTRTAGKKRPRKAKSGSD